MLAERRRMRASQFAFSDVAHLGVKRTNAVFGGARRPLTRPTQSRRVLVNSPTCRSRTDGTKSVEGRLQQIADLEKLGLGQYVLSDD
jgi:hypothetical protein